MDGSLENIADVLEQASPQRRALLEAVAALSEVHVPRVLQLVERLQQAVAVESLTPDHPIFTNEWVDRFAIRLQVHHATNLAPLNRTGFEDAFTECCEAAGIPVEPATSATNRFWDVKVGDLHASLKTEGSQAIAPDFIHISKLSEAAWIQDVRTATARRDKTLELFSTYRSLVDVIYMLRIFKALNPIRYELVEIPVDLFDPIQQLSRNDFTADAPSILIPPGSNPPDYRLRLDRSDAKITIARLRKDRCHVHAVWLVHTSSSGTLAED